MRRELLYKPHMLLERLLEVASRRHRLNRLRRTPARVLVHDHIQSLELLDIVQHEIAPRTVYDVGANRGTWSLLARSICPQAEIHAFEPLTEVREEFRKNVAAVGCVALHSVALGCSNVRTEMFVHRFFDASSFLPLTDRERAKWSDHLLEQRELELVTLDDYVAGHGLPAPDLLKLDVQGYEIEVLKGATRTLSRVSAVISEVSFRQTYAGQPLFGTVAGFLSAAGFETTAFSHGTKAGERLDQADVLFLRA